MLELKALIAQHAPDADGRCRACEPWSLVEWPCQTREVAERALKAEAKLAKLNSLFAGGPDTPCRTVWHDDADVFGVFGRSEYVEVPMDELREAFSDG